MKLWVNKDANNENNNFSTIQEALERVNEGDEIHIGPGIYREKIEIRTANICLVGESSENTVITFDDYADKKHEDGRNYGTFRSYSVLVEADFVSMENLTIENAAGDGREVGQAIALYVDASHFQAKHCQLIGFQDTLFLAPLPNKPRIPNSFIGPSEGKKYRQCLQYFENCQIIGDVDFIFGSGLSVFNRCRLISRDRKEKINGYVTAPSTWEEENYGFVFIRCVFAKEDYMEDHSVYLGRPWREYGKVSLYTCFIDRHIHDLHWDMWGKKENKKTARFQEHACLYNEDMRQVMTAQDGKFVEIGFGETSMDFLENWHQECLFKDKTIKAQI